MVAGPLHSDFAMENSLATASMLRRRFRFFPVGTLYLIAACLAISGCVISMVDSSLSADARHWDLPGDLAKAISLSEAFAHGFGASVILGAIFLVAVPRRPAIWLAIAITASSGLAANGLKYFFERVRPYAQNEIQAEEAIMATQSGKLLSDASTPEGKYQQQRVETPGTGPSSIWDSRHRSFPSGHTATAWGLAIGLTLVFPRGIWLFGALALMASLQRITSGAHFPSDVLAGASLAFACSAVVLSFSFPRQLMHRVSSD